MNATQMARGLHFEQPRANRLKSVYLGAVVAMFMAGSAFAQTTTGSGGATAAQARINSVALGWQNIVQGVGVAVLIMAWSYIGYQLAFGGKTMKDMGPTAMGTSVAGLAPILVGWMFS